MSKWLIERRGVVVLAGLLLFGVFELWNGGFYHTRHWTHFRLAADAQLGSQIELACPAGTTPLTGGTTVNSATGKFRQNTCVDAFGNLYQFFGGGVTLLFQGPNPWKDVTAGANPLVGDGLTDNTPNWNLTIAAACANKVHTLFFPIGGAGLGGQYVFNSRPNAIPCEIILLGQANQWNAFGTGTAALVKNYVESTATNGFISFTGSTSPGNSGIRGLLLYHYPAASGGAAITYSGTGTAVRAGAGPLEDVRVSGDNTGGGTNGMWDYGLYIDGTNIAVSGSQGIRDMELRNFSVFNTKTACMTLLNVVHFHWVHGGCFPTGTGPNATVNVSGTAAANTGSVNVSFEGVDILATLATDFVQNFVCAACYVNALTATVNTVQSKFDGVSNNAPVTSGQMAYSSFDPLSAAGYGTTLMNSLRVPNFIAASGSLPANITTGNILGTDFKLNSAAGLVDGNMIIRRNNGSGAGTNLAFTFDGFTTTPLQFDNVNGMTSTKPINGPSLPGLFNAAGTQQGIAHAVQDTATLAAGTVTVTLSGSAAFSNAGSYSCVADDDTAVAATKVVQNSGSSVTINGTGTDVVRFTCIGN